MALLAMPLIVSNLGSEMLYILEQRLGAQAVADEKATMVLKELVLAMFAEDFVDSLFKPQQIYSLEATHEIFGRIAHSSIMRLSEASMDKLFDLMLMGAKMQFVVSQAVDGMLAVTLRHLQVLRETLKKSPVPLSPDPIPLIDNFRALVHATYGSLPPGAWISLHRQLGNFFATRRVKVSLFLSEGIQARDSHFYLPEPKHTGRVTKFNSDGSVASHTTVELESQKEDSNEWYCHPMILGDNLYARIITKTVCKQPSVSGRQERAPPKPHASIRLAPTVSIEAGLLSLICHSTAKADFQLQLFGDDNAKAGGETDLIDWHSKSKVIKLGTEGNQAYKSVLANSMKGFDNKKVEEEDDDLLAMMDEASLT